MFCHPKLQFKKENQIFSLSKYSIECFSILTVKIAVRGPLYGPAIYSKIRQIRETGFI
jgi:hypothetical protein